MKPLNILLLSSRPMEWSANLGKDYVDVLEKRGHHVDFNFPGMQELLVNRRNHLKKKRNALVFKLLSHFKCLSVLHKFGLFFNIERLQPFTRNGYIVVNGSENEPLLDPYVIINNLSKKSYDIIITLFWENVISSYTLKKLFDFFHCPIFIISVDMAPMTGGCYYFSSCCGYKAINQCRKCPAVGGLFYSFPHKNYLKKKKNYDAIDVIYSCNSYMSKFAKESGMFKHIVIDSLIINENIFHPIDRDRCLKRFDIPSNKTFILLFRYAYQKRKGYSYVKEALLRFIENLDGEGRKRVLVLTVGYCLLDKDLLDLVDFIQLGFLEMNDLALAYNCSSVFLNPSIDDAGPTMVNQAMMCGTPIISFDSGIALDVVVNGISGYLVPVRDSASFGDRIFDVYNMKSGSYHNLRKTTLDIAAKWNKGNKFVNIIEGVSYSYKKIHEIIVE